VAFAGFLRSGEFTWTSWSDQHHQFHLSRKHVSFQEDHVTLMLPMSKTDPYRRGTTIHLPSSFSPLCPVIALTQLFRQYPSSPFQPLFSRPHGQPFSRQFFLLKLRELLLQIGVPTAGFSGHSIRKSAAITAAAADISRDDIKLLGRWKTDTVDIYINELPESDHNKKSLQLHSRLITSTY
jgi:hypothetical protein